MQQAFLRRPRDGRLWQAEWDIVSGIGFSPDKMLQARVLSYPDAHRYRLGVNDEALPVNRPHATAAHTYHRDGAMRCGANRGGAPSVIGLGNLGSQVATVGKAFGMSLVAWSQNLTAEHAAQYGATLVSKDELLPQSDIVTIHLVLSIRTRGLIGARELGLMKRTAYLVNTSRGPLLEEPALIQALQQGTIAGAGLNVFDEEPLPLDHPFRRLENTVITPHLGYVTLENYRLFFGDAVEDMRAFLSGTPTRVINVPRG